MRTELAESRHRLTDAATASETAAKEAAAAVADKEKVVASVREEIEARDALVREAAEKYQSELVLHAEDVRQMTVLRQEVGHRITVHCIYNFISFSVLFDIPVTIFIKIGQSEPE